LSEWLRPGPSVPPEAVAAALARAFLPAVAADPAPEWLRADQQLSFGRALAAIRRFGGALLADGVGTGKTYVALAVASRLEPVHPIHVVVPASLKWQWTEAARRTGLTILLHSHEALSRGRLPFEGRGAVIVDESHWFRSSDTQRYRTMRRWCLGRRGLLLSATPAVNRLEDVAHQLLLFVRDDALAWRGAATLLAGEFAELMVTGADRTGVLPSRHQRALVVVEPPGSAAAAILRGIESLTLSTDRGIASLVRVMLLQALASSPAAVADSLARYHALLLHAQDALAAGQRVTRQRIRSLVGSAFEQLVLWPMVAESAAVPELALEDLVPVGVLELLARDWGRQAVSKLDELRRSTSDHRPTLVFTTYAATVRHIRTRLGGSGVAWCTGQSAGLDRMPASREVVLDWFRRSSPPHPHLLVATDVAAEGLDLPLIERVIHYDLPWTAVRLEQRSGRAVRLTTTTKEIEVIRFLPGADLEALIRKEAIIDHKAVLPNALGLGDNSVAPWKLRARIAEEWSGRSTEEGIARVSGDRTGAVAGFRVVGVDGGVREVVKARVGSGWTDDPGTVSRLLSLARGQRARRTVDRAAVRAELRRFTGVVRAALATLHGAVASGGGIAPPARRMIRRLRRLAGAAIRARDAVRLGLLERGIGFLRRGHTAGEATLVEDWLALSDRELLEALGGMPAAPPEGIERVELIGLLLVERVGTGS
jgi:hypothetical protein